MAIDGRRVDSTDENAGTIEEAWFKRPEGIHVFAVFSWNSEGLSTRNEELLKAVLIRAAKTRSHWIVTYDANLEPGEFEIGDLYFEAGAQVKVLTKKCLRLGLARGRWLKSIILSHTKL